MRWCSVDIRQEKGRPLVKVAGDHNKYKLTIGVLYVVDDGKCHAPCAEQTTERHADDHAPAACTGGLLYINSVYCIDIYCMWWSLSLGC